MNNGQTMCPVLKTSVTTTGRHLDNKCYEKDQKRSERRKGQGERERQGGRNEF